MTSVVWTQCLKNFVNKKLKPKIKYDADAKIKIKYKNLYQNP